MGPLSREAKARASHDHDKEGDRKWLEMVVKARESRRSANQLCCVDHWTEFGRVIAGGTNEPLLVLMPCFGRSLYGLHARCKPALDTTFSAVFAPCDEHSWWVIAFPNDVDH